MATVINKGGTDKTVIEGIREYIAQPFQAPEWLDLRVGWLLSITGAVADDDPNAVGVEEIGTPPRPFLGGNDRVSIGLTDRATGTIFMGFTTRGQGSRPLTQGTTKLVSSDIGVGTTNAWFWRPTNEISNNIGVQITDQDALRAFSSDGSQIHFPHDVANAGGYAVLLALRLTRDNTGTRSKIITMTTKKTVGGHSGDVLFTNAPTETLLQTNLQSFPATVQQLGPVELSQVPDTIFVYWPFRSSRLRIHAMGIVKAA
jgi:hypothetical protein